MLVELSVRNFAIIPSLSVSFHAGLNVLTGETGAGKSIIIDAVSLLLGGRATTDFIRHQTDQAEVEGLFHIHAQHPAHLILSEAGLELDEDDQLIVSRVIHNQGKNVCRVNGRMVPVATLKDLSTHLIDIHGQHEHQSLLKEEEHLHFVDGYKSEELNKRLLSFREVFDRLRAHDQEMKRLSQNEQETAQRLDLLRFQQQEIQAAQLQPEEDTSLEKDRNIRMNAQNLYEGMEKSYAALFADDRAMESMGFVMQELHDLSTIDQSLQPMLEQIKEMYFQLEDVSIRVRDYRDKIEFEPELLNEIESRLNEIERLKRKYGPSVNDILTYADQIAIELDTLTHKDEQLAIFEENRKQLVKQVKDKASHISKYRQNVSTELVKEIKEQLRHLYMDKADICIDMHRLKQGYSLQPDDPTTFVNQHGYDQIRFMIAPNPGEPLKPLAKIASGGELSRFMLALKTVFSHSEPVSTMVFDEIDVGVSGRVANAMAEQLYAIGRNQQVLCITHQPQVAALADHHYRIVKISNESETATEVIELNTKEKEEELARMMSGKQVTKTTEQHASELIQTAASIKAKL